MVVATGLTLEDYEQLPDALALNRELVNGELIDVSGNTRDHNLVRDYLIELLRPYVRAQKLGRVISEREFAFGNDGHGPDVSFYGSEKVEREANTRVQTFVPDLAVEIASTNDKFDALLLKAEKYLKFGVKEVWILSTQARKGLIFQGSELSALNEQSELSTELIPGFSVRLADLLDNA